MLLFQVPFVLLPIINVGTDEFIDYKTQTNLILFESAVLE